MTTRRSDRSRLSWPAVVGWLPVWYVLWLVLVPSLNRWEAVVGVPVAAAASMALVAAGGSRWVRRQTAPALAAAFPLLVGDIVRDTVRLGVALSGRLRSGNAPSSRLRRERLPPPQTASGGPAQRASAIVRTALTPARMPIRFEGDELVVHELAPTGA